MHHWACSLLITSFFFFVQGMDMALSKLNSGGWVHIFPEGSRSRDGGKAIAPAKRGVGRLENWFLSMLSFSTELCTTVDLLLFW